MEFFLQFKSDNNDCFQTVGVEYVVQEMRHHRLRLNYTASGYGSKLPTRYKIKYDNRWYRVYSCCHSNVSTEFVRIQGEIVIVQTYSTD